MTPISILFIVIGCMIVVVLMVGRIVDALLRISRRIEETNLHLSRIRNLIVIKAEMDVGYDGGDSLLRNAVELGARLGHMSASLLQRHFKIGYARAARLLDTLEQEGYVESSSNKKLRTRLKKE